MPRGGLLRQLLLSFEQRQRQAAQVERRLPRLQEDLLALFEHVLVDQLGELLDRGVVRLGRSVSSSWISAMICLGFGVLLERFVHQRVVADRFAHRRVEDFLLDLRVDGQRLADALGQRMLFARTGAASSHRAL